MHRDMPTAQVLGTFCNGRVERFIPFRPLEPQQLSEAHVAAAVARRLAQLHAARIAGSAAEAQIFPKIYSWCACRPCAVCSQRLLALSNACGAPGRSSCTRW